MHEEPSSSPLPTPQLPGFYPTSQGATTVDGPTTASATHDEATQDATSQASADTPEHPSHAAGPLLGAATGLLVGGGLVGALTGAALEGLGSIEKDAISHQPDSHEATPDTQKQETTDAPKGEVFPGSSAMPEALLAGGAGAGILKYEEPVLETELGDVTCAALGESLGRVSLKDQGSASGSTKAEDESANGSTSKDQSSSSGAALAVGAGLGAGALAGFSPADDGAIPSSRTLDITVSGDESDFIPPSDHEVFPVIDHKAPTEDGAGSGANVSKTEAIGAAAAAAGGITALEFLKDDNGVVRGSGERNLLSNTQRAQGSEDVTGETSAAANNNSIADTATAAVVGDSEAYQSLGPYVNDSRFREELSTYTATDTETETESSSRPPLTSQFSMTTTSSSFSEPERTEDPFDAQRVVVPVSMMRDDGGDEELHKLHRIDPAELQAVSKQVSVGVPALVSGDPKAGGFITYDGQKPTTAAMEFAALSSNKTSSLHSPVLGSTTSNDTTNGEESRTKTSASSGAALAGATAAGAGIGALATNNSRHFNPSGASSDSVPASPTDSRVAVRGSPTPSDFPPSTRGASPAPNESGSSSPVPSPVVYSPHMKISTRRDSIGRNKLHKDSFDRKSSIASKDGKNVSPVSRNASTNNTKSAASAGASVVGAGYATAEAEKSPSTAQAREGEQVWKKSVHDVVNEETVQRGGQRPRLLTIDSESLRASIIDRTAGVKDPFASPSRAQSTHQRRRSKSNSQSTEATTGGLDAQSQPRRKLQRERRDSIARQSGDLTDEVQAPPPQEKKEGFLSKVFGHSRSRSGSKSEVRRASADNGTRPGFVENATETSSASTSSANLVSTKPQAPS